MFRKPLFFVGALCLAIFSPVVSSAKTTTYYYQPQFMAKLDDATTRLSFLSAHLHPGDRWDLADRSQKTYLLSRIKVWRKGHAVDLVVPESL